MTSLPINPPKLPKAIDERGLSSRRTPEADELTLASRTRAEPMAGNVNG